MVLHVVIYINNATLTTFIYHILISPYVTNEVDNTSIKINLKFY